MGYGPFDMSIRMPDSAWNNNQKPKRPASESCIAEGPYLPSKKAKTVPASNPSLLEADRTVRAVSTEPPVIRRTTTGQDWANPVRRAQSAPSDGRGQVQEQDSDGPFIEGPSRRRATDLFYHSENHPLPRECFFGKKKKRPFPGPRAQEAIVASLTRQALQHFEQNQQPVIFTHSISFYIFGIQLGTPREPRTRRIKRNRKCL